MRRILPFLFILLLPLRPVLADPIEVDAAPVPLNERDASETRAGRLEYLAGFALDSGDRRWGGFSSMILSADGGRITAISDFGNWLRLELRHDTDGRLIGIGAAEMGFLPGPDGKPLGGKGAADAEGLSETPDGGLLVSFEREARIWRYDDGEPPFAAPPTAFPSPKAIVMLPANSGLESIVRLGDGDIVAIAEGAEDRDGDIPGWLRRGQTWHPIAWVRTPPYRPTDAALLPDGDLLVVERRYSLAGGPGARLSVVAAGGIVPGARLAGTPLAELKLPQSVDNFEGVAARAADDGSTHIYLLSDDNRNPLQRTLLLQFRWTP